MVTAVNNKVLQKVLSTLQKFTLCGKILLILVLLLSAFGGYVLFADPELVIDPTFVSFTPEERVGVGEIGIQQSRQVWCFGFRGARAFTPKLEIDEIKKRAKKQDVRSQIELVIKNGQIYSIKRKGSWVGGTALHDYVKQVIEAWGSGTGPRFTDFIEKLEVMLTIYQDGTMDVLFKDIEWSQPCDPSAASCLRFYYVSRQNSKIRNIFPLEGIKIGKVTTAAGVRDKFRRLEEQKTSFCNGKCS